MAGKPSYDELRKRIEQLENESCERRRIEHELQYRLAFEALITSISSTFINLPPTGIDAAVTDALKQLGEFSQVSGAAYKDGGGQPVGSIITLRDIREKKKMEQQLLNMQRMESIGTLAGGIAHDFNNLLMAIQGNISLALYDLDEGDPHRRVTFDQIKQIKPGVQILLSSGYSMDGQVAAILQRGCAGFIQKPFSIEALSAKIREILV